MRALSRARCLQGQEVAGKWLHTALLFGATICLVGLYNSTIITCETSLLFFLQTYFPSFVSDDALKGASFIRRWCFQRTEAGYGKPLPVLPCCHLPPCARARARARARPVAARTVARKRLRDRHGSIRCDLHGARKRLKYD